MTLFYQHHPSFQYLCVPIDEFVAARPELGRCSVGAVTIQCYRKCDLARDKGRVGLYARALGGVAVMSSIVTEHCSTLSGRKSMKKQAFTYPKFLHLWLFMTVIIEIITESYIALRDIRYSLRLAKPPDHCPTDQFRGMKSAYNSH